MKRMILSLISLLFATGLAMAQEVSTAVVSTKSGKVSGIIQEGTMAYLGIPYAKRNGAVYANVTTGVR